MTGSASKVGANPYVGPRPFEPGETLYGREDEISELYYLWKAERIVLLHSPSGAGKSSLLQAGLLPRIKTSFDVWGPTRVNQEPPTALRDTVPGAGGTVNRYLLSALQGFEEGVPERLRRPAQELAGMRLAEYVEKRPRQRKKASRSVALLFDQFEEILTVDPLAEDAKREFFDQLGELLRNPQVWALFVLREDYLAPLDPYTRRVPTHLKNRFRIDLLSLDGAREAMVQPAAVGGREFPAVDQLLRDLATMKVQRSDGSFVEQTGRHVEPVQLQVVCFRLWDAMPADDLSIDAADLKLFGDVTEALAGYYADSLTRISGGAIDRERAVREWFGERLITAGGIRGQVLRGAEQSEGLANEIIEELVDTHLVRAEERAGATWYELAHDRLIEPVRNDNAAWRAEHLSEFQQRATLWEGQGRPPGLLLRDQELVEAESWAVGSAVITAVEVDFLDESRQAQDAAARERRQARRIKWLGIAAMVIGALALVAGAVAASKWLEAEEQKADAIAQREEAVRNRFEAEKAKDAAERREQEAREAEQKAREAEAEAEHRRLEALSEKQRADEERQKADEERQKAEANEREAQRQKQKADQARATAEKKEIEAVKARQEEALQRQKAEELRLRELARALAVQTPRLLQEEKQRELAALLAVQAYHLNLANGGEPEAAEIYDALWRSLLALDPQRGAGIDLGSAVRAVALAADGTLAAGTEDGRLYLRRPGEVPAALAWPVDEGAGTEAAATGDDMIRSLAVSPAGRWLAAGAVSGAVLLWDMETEEARHLGEHRIAPGLEGDVIAAVSAVAFDLSGGLFSGSFNGEIRHWDPEKGSEELWLDAGTPVRRVLTLAASGDGTTLAAAREGGGVLIWELSQTPTEPVELATQHVCRALAFSRDSATLACGRGDGTIDLWGLSSEGAVEQEPLPGHSASVNALRFNPELDLLASASSDGSLRLWSYRTPDTEPIVLKGHTFWVWTLAWSADGTALTSGSSDRTVRDWATHNRQLVDEICRRVERRGLSEAEWRRFIGSDISHETTCLDGSEDLG